MRPLRVQVATHPLRLQSRLYTNRLSKLPQLVHRYSRSLIRTGQCRFGRRVSNRFVVGTQSGLHVRGIQEHTSWRAPIFTFALKYVVFAKDVRLVGFFLHQSDKPFEVPQVGLATRHLRFLGVSLFQNGPDLVGFANLVNVKCLQQVFRLFLLPLVLARHVDPSGDTGKSLVVFDLITREVALRSEAITAVAETNDTKGFQPWEGVVGGRVLAIQQRIESLVPLAWLGGKPCHKSCIRLRPCAVGGLCFQQRYELVGVPFGDRQARQEVICIAVLLGRAYCPTKRLAMMFDQNFEVICRNQLLERCPRLQEVPGWRVRPGMRRR